MKTHAFIWFGHDSSRRLTRKKILVKTFGCRFCRNARLYAGLLLLALLAFGEVWLLAGMGREVRHAAITHQSATSFPVSLNQMTFR